MQVHHRGKASEKGVHCHCQRLTQTQLLFPEHTFFFYQAFLSQTFTIQRTAGEGGGYLLYSSSLPLPPASQIFRYQPGDHCRERTSAYFQQPDSNRESLVSKLNFLTAKLSVTSMQFFFSLLATFLKNVRIMTVR